VTDKKYKVTTVLMTPKFGGWISPCLRRSTGMAFGGGIFGVAPIPANYREGLEKKKQSPVSDIEYWS